MPANDGDTLLPFPSPSICQKKVTAAFDGGLISSDGGVLLLAGADRRLGLIDTLAAIIPDHRDREQVTHTMFEILRGGSSPSPAATRTPTIRTIRATTPLSSWPADVCRRLAMTRTRSRRCRAGQRFGELARANETLTGRTPRTSAR
jgi:hypothetical protein